MSIDVNKVDMSLDDIIKLDKKKTGETRRKGPRLQSRGGFRKGFRRGSLRQRGGRGGGRGARRIQRLNSGISPLNQDENSENSVGTQGAVSLADKRKKAVEALRRAKERVALLTQQQQRQNIVNQRRGIQENTNPSVQRTVNSGTRGARGRGRAFANRSFGSRQSQFRNQTYTDLANRGRVRGRGRSVRGRGRGQSLRGRGQSMDAGWFELRTSRQQTRGKMNRSVKSDFSSNDGIFTISVHNPTPRMKIKRSKLQQAIQNLKPAVSTNYKFNPGFFAHAGTSLSLNDRFASNDTERKIFF